MAILFESEWEWTLKLRFNQPHKLYETKKCIRLFSYDKVIT